MMSIEESIFQKYRLNCDKLVPYGFEKKDGKYIYSKTILNNSFRVDVEINGMGVVKGKIIELSFNEEYTNFRVKDFTGEFVSLIRNEFENILIEIREKCFSEKYFVSVQANRITDLIIKKYGNIPDFAWDKFPGYGIFRNPNNEKWYGLIMNVNKRKIDEGNEDVEIINVKLDEEKIKELLNKKGYYKAYHMNKDNWVSIILDNTLSDDEIMSLVTESHKFTENPDEWIVPANPKYHDVMNCFNDTDTMIWKQSNNIKVGDIVYLYVAGPYSSILYKCKVLETNIPYEYKDKNISMKKVMKIKLLSKYDKDKYSLHILKEYGIKAVRGPRRMPEKLSKIINKK